MNNKKFEKISKIFSEQEFKNVFFVACGASSAVMYPSKFLMDRESKNISSDLYSSNEFIYRNPGSLSKQSVVILCSLSGNTPETVKAAKFAKEKGALTISLSIDLLSPLARNSDYCLQFNWGKDVPVKETNIALLHLIVSLLLYKKENNQLYLKLLECFDYSLDPVLRNAERIILERAETFAALFKDKEVIYTSASGGNFGPAYSFSICILMEMQWIHSNAIHAGEYFHGPFEIMDEDVAMISLLGLDETRDIEERALNFSNKYSQSVFVLDAKNLNYENDVNPEVIGYITPLVLHHVLRWILAEELAKARNHSLETRRYMWKVSY